MQWIGVNKTVANLQINLMHIIKTKITINGNICFLNLRDPDPTLMPTIDFNDKIILPSETANYFGVNIEANIQFKNYIALQEKIILQDVLVLLPNSHYLPCKT